MGNNKSENNDWKLKPTNFCQMPCNFGRTYCEQNPDKHLRHGVAAGVGARFADEGRPVMERIKFQRLKLLTALGKTSGFQTPIPFFTQSLAFKKMALF